MSTAGRRENPTREIEAASQAIESAIVKGGFVSLPKAAELADVSEWYMRTLVQAGKVQGVRVGRNYWVSAASARAFKRSPNMGRPRSKTRKK